MSYHVMISGVSDARALTKRVTHTVYLLKWTENIIEVVPHIELLQKLVTLDIPHNVEEHQSNSFVYLTLPQFSRRCDDGSPKQLVFPLSSYTIETAYDSMLDWIKSNVVS